VCTANPSFVLHNLSPGPILEVNITGSVTYPSNTIPSPSVASSISPPAQTALTTSSFSGHSVAIGVGVGVPLAVALVLAVAWAVRERSKRTKVLGGLAGPVEADGAAVGYHEGKNGWKHQGFQGELDGRRLHELQ
jgi:hypothetical protein